MGDPMKKSWLGFLGVLGFIAAILLSLSAILLSRTDATGSLAQNGTSVPQPERNGDRVGGMLQQEYGIEHSGNPSSGQHSEHQDDGGEYEEDVVRLDAEQRAALDLKTDEVRQGSVTGTVTLSAEVQFDPNQVAHLVPRVSGIVREVRKGIGDSVAKKEVLAVLDSRELAEAKSAYLAALAMQELAQATFEREKSLWEKRITAEQDYLVAKQGMEEARIKVRVAEQQLHALGFSREYLEKLPKEPDTSLTRYEITAPFDARIVDRHITLGETVQNHDQVFYIAHLSPVWVMGRAYERDIRHIRKGQRAVIRLDAYPNEKYEGTVDYIGYALDIESRTVEVRVVLANNEERIREGMFGQMAISLEQEPDGSRSLLVPTGALQRVASGFIVFKILEPGEFKAIPVIVLSQSKDFAEVQGVLQPGDPIIVGDTFVLKSELDKKEMGEGHGH